MSDSGRTKYFCLLHGPVVMLLMKCYIRNKSCLNQMGVMRRSKKVSSFELHKFNPLSPHCGSIAQELVHCYSWGRLRIVTVRGNTLGQHS